MKRKIMLSLKSLLFASIMLLIISCGGGGGGGNGGQSNTAPVATILSPQSGLRFDQFDVITLQGSGSDAEDGSLVGSSLVWNSDKDGQLGTGELLKINSLSPNTHTITLLVSDSKGLTTSNSISVTVLSVPILFSGAEVPFQTPTEMETVTLPSGLEVNAAKDEVLVSVQQDLTEAQLQNLLKTIKSLGASVIGEDSDIMSLQIRIPSDVSESSLISQLKNIDGVKGVTANIVGEVDQLVVTPDPDNFSGGYWADHINVKEAWNISKGVSSLLIGIVDSGINLDANVSDVNRISRFSVLGSTLTSRNTDDTIEHGTRVTALAASDGFRDDNAVGVCWGTNIVNIDIDTVGGLLAEIFSSTQLQGIKRAIKQGARIVNLSGGPGPLPAKLSGTNQEFIVHRQEWRESIAPAVDFAREKGTLLVLSAGNDGLGKDKNHSIDKRVRVHNDDKLLPTGSKHSVENWQSNVIIVAATNESKEVADFSRQGNVVNIAAPGDSISYGAEIETRSGTSYAAPLVTGTACLVASVDPQLSASEIREILLATATPIERVSVGAGLLNAHAAVLQAQATISPVVNNPPSPTATAISTTTDKSGTSQISVNDPDAGQSHTFAITTQPTNGSATVSSSGLVTYTPKSGFTGSDSLVVTVTDNGTPPLSGKVTVNVTVTSAATKITVSRSVSSTSAWQDTGIDVKAGDTITIIASGSVRFDTSGGTSTPNGSGGFATINSDGTCNFLVCGSSIPEKSLVGRIGSSDLKDFTNGFFVGSSFTMTATKSGRLFLGFNDGFVKPDRSGLDVGAVNDNSGSFSTTITVSSGTPSDEKPVNHTPVPTAPSITTTAGKTGTSQITVDDQDIGQTHAFTITRQPSNGTATVNTSGLVTYTPKAGFTGSDSLIVTVTDSGSPPLSGAVTIAVTVSPTTVSPTVSFAPARNFPVGDTPQCVAIGDLNNDGRLDLAVANFNFGPVFVLLGDGSGSFSKPTDFDVNGFPDSIAIGDLNGDGRLDIVVNRTAPTTPVTGALETVSVLLGDGSGSFGTARRFEAGPFDHGSVVIGDLNSDRKQDVVVPSSGSDIVSVLLGNGDGTLQTARNFATGVDPLTVAIGDVNGDGKMDVVTANQGSNNISVLLGNGDGTFQTARNFSVGEAPHGVAIGDLNGDGKLDIAVANGNSNNVSVLIGDGRGGFAPARNFGADNSPFSIAIGDLNSDGKFDLAVANFSAGTISVLLGKGDGTFQTAQNFLVGKFLNCITIVDLNGDGKPDVVVVNEDANSISVLLNNTP